jgi:hypothetical protein
MPCRLCGTIGDALAGAHQADRDLQFAHFLHLLRHQVAFPEGGQHLVGEARARRFRVHEQRLVHQVRQLQIALRSRQAVADGQGHDQRFLAQHDAADRRIFALQAAEADVDAALLERLAAVPSSSARGS